MNSEEQKSPEMLLAEQRLAEARRTSADIAAKTEKLHKIAEKINGQLACVDLALERRKFFEANEAAYFAWASGEGKMPSSKALDSIENDQCIMLRMLNEVALKLRALEAAAKLSASDERGISARILRLQSQEEDQRAARALASVREEIGEHAVITVERGVSQELEAQADRLIIESAALRRESDELLKQLRDQQKGTG